MNRENPIPASPMLERAARALCAHTIALENPALVPEHVQRWAACDWPNYMDEARAVLEALLEPDDGTVEAMLSDCDYNGYAVSRGMVNDRDVRTAFTAAIHHILKGDA